MLFKKFIKIISFMLILNETSTQNIGQFYKIFIFNRNFFMWNVSIIQFKKENSVKVEKENNEMSTFNMINITKRRTTIKYNLNQISFLRMYIKKISIILKYWN